MNRRWRALAALILLASPLAAQVVTGRIASPIVATPLIVPSLSAAAGAATVVVPTLLSSPLSAVMAAPSALTVSAPIALPAAPAAAFALPTLSAAADGLKSAPTNTERSQAGADSPAGSYGRVLFDGSGRIVSQHGTVFVPTPKIPGDARRTARLVQVGPAAKATVRPVSGTEGLSGKELLDTVGQIAAKNQKTNEYKAASHYIFKTADHVMVGGVSGVVDAYSGTFVPGNSDQGGDYPERGDEDGDGYHEGNGMNIEHTWPQSLFGRGLPMRADIHHLMATFQHPNSVRGSLPFGEVKGRPDYENKAGAKRGDGYFEPPDMTKGRVARSLLYFYARYKGSPFMNGRVTQFWNGQIETMLRWNREFPPDAQEMRRNDLVEQYQGNRNPFVDDPGLADRIGADALRSDRGGRSSSAMGRMSFEPRSDTPRKGKHRRSVKRGSSSKYARR